MSVNVTCYGLSVNVVCYLMFVNIACCALSEVTFTDRTEQDRVTART
jgi:hypothetical protein